MFCPNPVAFTVFGHDIYWYGIFISLSVVLAVIMVYREARRKGLDADCMLDYALLTVPVAIVFARIYYVIFEWDQYAADPVRALYIWEGGIAIYGSIIGGVIATLIFSKWKKISFWTLADLVAPGLVLGQAIGRWGNFFNQEAFGELVTNPKWQFFPFAVYIERLGEWHLATFFYESMACLLIFIFLLIYRRKAKNVPDGNVFLWYWVLYGIERAYVEGLRTDSLWMFKGGIPVGNLIFFPNGLRVSQVLSIVMVIAFSILLLVRYTKRRKAAAVQTQEAETLDPELVLIDRDEEPELQSERADGDPEHSQPEAEDRAEGEDNETKLDGSSEK
jgi:phosphatidylglycerol:prolipoprotein diacylglycerol transferase